MYCQAVGRVGIWVWLRRNLKFQTVTREDILGKRADVADASDFRKLMKGLSGGGTDYTEKSGRR